MTLSFNVTPKTTEQHLIVRSDKSVAYVTNNKSLYSEFCNIELTTDRHEASRGLFATAELLVLPPWVKMRSIRVLKNPWNGPLIGYPDRLSILVAILSKVKVLLSVSNTPVTPEARCHYGFW